MPIKDPKAFLPTRDAINRQLKRMQGSPDFNATPQQIALLKYVVDQTLAGHTDRIKGYLVATRVFGRSSDFDQSIDPIVSIQASRLRQAINRYYETAGKKDPLRIDIPRGTYIPEFDEQFPGDEPTAAQQAVQADAMAAWPTVMIRPLANLSANSEDNYLAVGLTAELAHALNHYPEIRILEARHRDQKPPSPEMDFNFVIDGNIRRDPGGVNVAIRLSDAGTGLQIWSGKYQGNPEAVEMISFQEDVAAEVAVRLTGGYAMIPKHLSGQSKNRPVPDLTTYEAMLRYWEYDTQRTRPGYMRAIEALEHAAAIEPGCGQTWSMLASLYADNYALEMVDLPTPLEKAAEFAHRGVGLDPTSRRARAIIAYVLLLENKLQEACDEVQTAQRMHSHSLMYLDVIGWLMALAGEWQRGEKLINKAIQFNPYHRPWVRHAIFLNWFRTGDYQKAYRETLNFMMPEYHWDPLLKASVCGHLGRIVEGQACVRALLALKPDFAQRGRILIGRYVKFEAIADRIIDGLGKLKLKIEA